MYTQSRKNEGLSQDYLTEAPLRELLVKLARTQPPRLRLGQTSDSCVNCKHFIYAAGRAHSGDGECTEFRTFVREDFVCDAHLSEDEG